MWICTVSALLAFPALVLLQNMEKNFTGQTSFTTVSIGGEEWRRRIQRGLTPAGYSRWIHRRSCVPTTAWCSYWVQGHSCVSTRACNATVALCCLIAVTAADNESALAVVKWRHIRLEDHGNYSTWIFCAASNWWHLGPSGPDSSELPVAAPQKPDKTISFINYMLAPH